MAFYLPKVSVRLASTSGAVRLLEAGEPYELTGELETLAEIMGVAHNTGLESGLLRSTDRPMPAKDKRNAVLDTVKLLLSTGKPTDFVISTGLPKAGIVTDTVGFRVTSADIKKAVDEVKEGLNYGEG